MKKVLFCLAAMITSVAHAQTASVCDSLAGGTTVSIPLASGFSPSGAPQDRATELGLAVLTALPNGPSIGSAICVRYLDQVTAQVTLTCSTTYGASTYCSAKEVVGTRRSMPLRTSQGYGCKQYAPGQTVTFYITTIWYYPSTGEIDSMSSIPFELNLGQGCMDWGDGATAWA